MRSLLALDNGSCVAIKLFFGQFSCIILCCLCAVKIQVVNDNVEISLDSRKHCCICFVLCYCCKLGSPACELIYIFSCACLCGLCSVIKRCLAPFNYCLIEKSAVFVNEFNCIFFVICCYNVCISCVTCYFLDFLIPSTAVCAVVGVFRKSGQYALEYGHLTVRQQFFLQNIAFSVNEFNRVLSNSLLREVISTCCDCGNNLVCVCLCCKVQAVACEPRSCGVSAVITECVFYVGKVHPIVFSTKCLHKIVCLRNFSCLFNLSGTMVNTEKDYLKIGIKSLEIVQKLINFCNDCFRCS